MTEIEIKTKMVPQRYIELPYTEKIWRSWDNSVSRHEPGGVAEFDVNELYEFWDHGQYGSPGFTPAYIGFSWMQERALEEKGWSNGATRGGVWPTEAFNEWMREQNLI